MSEIDFINFVAIDGIGYALMDGSYIEDIEDKKIRKKVILAHKLLKEIEIWIEKHPDYEVM